MNLPLLVPTVWVSSLFLHLKVHVIQEATFPLFLFPPGYHLLLSQVWELGPALYPCPQCWRCSLDTCLSIKTFLDPEPLGSLWINHG